MIIFTIFIHVCGWRISKLSNCFDRAVTQIVCFHWGLFLTCCKPSRADSSAHHSDYASTTHHHNTGLSHTLPVLYMNYGFLHSLTGDSGPGFWSGNNVWKMLHLVVSTYVFYRCSHRSWPWISVRVCTIFIVVIYHVCFMCTPRSFFL